MRAAQPISIPAGTPTQGQVDLVIEDMAFHCGLAFWEDGEFVVAHWPQFNALVHYATTTPGAIDVMRRIVAKRLWTKAKIKHAKARESGHPRTWNQMTGELEGFKREYNNRGRVSEENPLCLKLGGEPSFRVNKAQGALILGEMAEFYDSTSFQVTPHPGERPTDRKKRGRWHSQLQRHQEETDWANGFPKLSLDAGTEVSLVLIRILSSDNEWAAFENKWRNIKDGQFIPYSVLQVFNPKEKKQRRRRA